ncbi:MAG: hypothetical protein KKB20_17975 [Proteobacteria bacterium]|nr:hypothetical protein [Pseudomonadota bacterium]
MTQDGQNQTGKSHKIPDYARAHGQYKAVQGRMMAKYPNLVRTSALGKPTLSPDDLPPGPDRDELAAAKYDLSEATNNMFEAQQEAAGPDDVGDTSAPCPLARQNQRESPEKKAVRERRCPHVWVEERRETPQETIKGNEKSIEAKEGKPDQEGFVRGWRFENKVIAALDAQGLIEATSVVFRCEECGARQETDILLKNGQVVEVKSISKSRAKNLADQTSNIEMIQTQHGDKGQRPKAILDGSLPHSGFVEEKYKKRGFDVQVFN